MCLCCSRQFVENAISNSLDVENFTNAKGKFNILQVNVDKLIIDGAEM